MPGIGSDDAAMRYVLINDPEHWRRRAKQARSIAESIADAEARGMMLGVAEGFDKLAARAEEKTLTKGDGRARKA